jgi:hypothetical protein
LDAGASVTERAIIGEEKGKNKEDRRDRASSISSGASENIL